MLDWLGLGLLVGIGVGRYDGQGTGVLMTSVIEKSTAESHLRMFHCSISFQSLDCSMLDHQH